MKTERLAIDSFQPDTDVIERAAAIIRRGGLVAFPTETVYGLGADALNAEAVAKIFEAKQRPADDPIIAHIANPIDVSKLARHISPAVQKLAEAFWPGPLTLVVPKAAIVPDILTAGGSTVAVRCPRHPIALALIRAAGTPIGAPSANRFSHTSPTTADHVWEDLAGRIDLILDGGPSQVGVESTVVDLTTEEPTVLRPGGVSVETLERVIGRVRLLPKAVPAARPAASPGLLERHYAPRAKLWLFTGNDEAVRAAMQAALQRAAAQGRMPALLLADDDLPFFTDANLTLASVGPRDNLKIVAHNLFRTLRQLDAAGPDLILARDFPAEGLGLAIRDRLRRAAHKIVG